MDDSGALLNAILEAAVDAIVVADANGVIANANQAAGKMFQRSRREIIGKNVKTLMPDDVAELHDGFMRRFIETGEKRIIGIGRDVEGMRKDGSKFPLHLSVGTSSADGQQMFVAIMHDLTLRVATQNALARSQRLDAVGQMTGGISHDFNNLLTVIIGNLELAQMRDPEAATASLIAEALEAAAMGADLTSRLMVFARRSDLKPVEADIRTLCEDALAILKRTLGTRIKIQTELARSTARVLVDPVQFQSALVNLALNARDAMDAQGELLIAVEDVTIDDTYMAQEIDVEVGDYVRLSVSDNGAGMDEEAQKRAFEPFYTTKSESGGNGMGLAMVYGFVRQSNGHITLYSEPGLGTSFGLYFPALPETRVMESVATNKTAEQVTSGFGRGRTVLVVEDNPKVRKSSVTRIRDLGFETVEAMDGDTAYTMLKEGLNVDIVFSDVVMPGALSGYDLADKVIEKFPDTQVLLTSGYASDVVKKKNLEILHKPFRQSDLVRRLQALLLNEPEP